MNNLLNALLIVFLAAILVMAAWIGVNMDLCKRPSLTAQDFKNMKLDCTKRIPL